MAEITSVKRAIQILSLFTSDNAELGLTDVVRQLRVNKSTVLRLMSTLASVNLIKKSANNRKYRLTGKVVEMAKAYLANADLQTVAMPYMEEIREKTNESVAIFVRDGDQRTRLVMLESKQPLRLVGAVGDRGPLHAGAPSRLLLASLSDKEIDEIIARTGLPRYTNTTITNKSLLKKEIENIRRTGISLSKGEQIEYSYAVAAPLRNYTGKIIGALSIIGIIMRLTPEKEREVSILVKEAAADISQELGYFGE